jgi:hypothetical protein
MNWLSKTLGIAALVTLMAAPSMAAYHLVGPRFVVGPRVFVGPGYGYFGPSWRYPYYRPAYALGPATGQVKIDTHLKDASVYVDGGFVGPVNKFSKFGLLPGNHNIELRDASGQTIFHQKVQVLVDRTTEIRSPA